MNIVASIVPKAYSVFKILFRTNICTFLYLFSFIFVTFMLKSCCQLFTIAIICNVIKKYHKTLQKVFLIHNTYLYKLQFFLYVYNTSVSASRGTWGGGGKSPLPYKIFKKIGWSFFSISLGRVVVTSSKIVINLPKTYIKLHYKREPYRFSCKRDPSVQTDRHTDKDPFTLLYGLAATPLEASREPWVGGGGGG